MLSALLSGYLLALLSLLFFRKIPRFAAHLIPVLVAGLAAYFYTYWGSVSYENTKVFDYQWVSTLDVNLNFYLDGLSLFFVLLITTFGSIILFYSEGYMRNNPHANRFFAYMLIFMASMLGLVLSGNIIQIYIFWELTSISSFLLIAFESHGANARKAALQALLVTAGGGLALLAGLILVGIEADSMYIADILKHDFSDSPYLYAILILIFLGAFTKSAQFPFHFWLPNAMEAPTPVSAYLHSATMVKAGIFLIFRFNPLFEGIDTWQYTLMLVGSVSMIMGAIRAMLQTDLKKILAYVTISTLGLVIAAIGIGTKAALKAAIVYLFVHALYKGCMFMIAGNVDHGVGTKNIRKLGGLAKKMPLTASAAILSGLSMAGFPPLMGFIGKEKLYEASLHAPVLEVILTAGFFLSSVLYVGIAIVIAYGVFFGKRKSDTFETAHEVHFSMWLGPLLLAVAGLVLGITNQALATDILGPAVSEIAATLVEVELKLWHGFNWVLLLSVLTLASGILLYKFRGAYHKLLSFTNKLQNKGAGALYFKALEGLDELALAQTRFIQSGYLRNYLITIIVFFTLCSAYIYVIHDLLPENIPELAPIQTRTIYEFTPILLIGAGFYKIFDTRSRLTMLVSVGLLGFGVATIFIFFSAPDVSITQFLVETVTLLFFMLIIHRLPRHKILGNSSRRFIHLAVSLLFGCMMTLILLSVESVESPAAFKEFYLENSVPIGKGQNVVNVILVDFRALDTLGEVIVLCITALGIVALNQLNLKSKEK